MNNPNQMAWDLYWNAELLIVKHTRLKNKFPLAKHIALDYAKKMHLQAASWGVNSVLGFWAEVIIKIDEMKLKAK